jgi:bisphosphoglycerate-independent phosphoglycerate mutase (AlkP superfamily)
MSRSTFTTLFPFAVPFTCSSKTHVFRQELPTNDDGKPRARALRDVAPTVLQLLGLSIAEEMDGKPLLEEKEATA